MHACKPALCKQSTDICFAWRITYLDVVADRLVYMLAMHFFLGKRHKQ
jgi:hypothetical protein